MLKQRKIQFLTTADLFALTPGPIKEPMCTYINGEDFIRPLTNTFNLVLCRNIQKNVETAAELAIGLANKFKDKKVLLVNTYAGQSLMKHTVSTALGRNHLGKDAQALPNFSIMDVPTGLWNTHKLKRRILDTGVSTLIINSFEFTAMSRSIRDRVARELIELKDRIDLDIILFSHDMKNDIEVFTPARGALGLISAFAGSVWKLDMPLTPEIAGIIADYMAKSGNVHEQKTSIASLESGIRDEILGIRGEKFGVGFGAEDEFDASEVAFDELPPPSQYTVDAVNKKNQNIIQKSPIVSWLYFS